MALGTKDVKGGKGDFTSFYIEPGNNEIYIDSVEMKEFPFKENAHHLIFKCRTESIEGFKGFDVDKNDPSKGKLDHQVGDIKHGYYAFVDAEIKGEVYSKEDQAMTFFKNLCDSLGINDWFLAQDNKHETLEAFVAAFNSDAPFKDVKFHACIGAKEYENKQGYKGYDLFFPKFSKGKAPFTTDEDKVLEFDKEDENHFKPYVKKEIESFDSDDSSGDDEDFEL